MAWPEALVSGFCSGRVFFDLCIACLTDHRSQHPSARTTRARRRHRLPKILLRQDVEWNPQLEHSPWLPIVMLIFKEASEPPPSFVLKRGLGVSSPLLPFGPGSAPTFFPPNKRMCLLSLGVWQGYKEGDPLHLKKRAEIGARGAPPAPAPS